MAIIISERNNVAVRITKQFLKNYDMAYGKLYREKRKGGVEGYAIKFYGICGGYLLSNMEFIRKLNDKLGIYGLKAEMRLSVNAYSLHIRMK